MNLHNLEIIYDSTCSKGSGGEDTESNIGIEQGKTERIGWETESKAFFLFQKLDTVLFCIK
jgi:hypothetical protein